ncbi:universal stress protein [Chitinophaga sp. Mgbs1]|uniref:Universal stress protein n=1 Tax=Chitinophaga solisilvae TaxID=1233460 RepID=A0A433WEC0_9BACT|nr:universal stress protein [Chitinophaga solisilvae]
MTVNNDIKVLAGFDLSDMDPALVRYLEVLEQWLPVQQFIFLHNIKINELPEEMRSASMLTTIAQRIRKKITETIRAIYTPRASFDVRVTFEPFSEIAFTQACQQQKTDLVLLGNKQQLEGSGGLSQKLIRMLPAAVLLVPETFRGFPHRIAMAIDFSRYTPAIVQWQQFIARSKPGSEDITFTPVYVSKMSYHFFPILSDHELEASLKKDEAEKSKKWRTLYAAQSPLHIIHAHEKNIASTLLSYARHNNIHIILMGVKGASSLTNLFMGSVANEMVQRETDVCLLLVKHK